MFTKREEQVLDLVIKNRTNHEIADELNISLETVRSYKKRIGYKIKMAESTDPKKKAKH